MHRNSSPYPFERGLAPKNRGTGAPGTGGRKWLVLTWRVAGEGDDWRCRVIASSVWADRVANASVMSQCHADLRGLAQREMHQGWRV